MRAGLHKYGAVYGHLWRTFGSTWQINVSYLLQLLTRVCKLIALPIALSLIITRLSTQDYSGAQSAVVLYVCFSALLGLLTPLAKYIGSRGENKVYRALTAHYFAKLISADIDYFNSNLSGYLTTATRQYVDSTVQLVRTLRDRYMMTILSIVFPLCVIMWLDRPLGFITLVLSLANAIYMIWASHAITPYRTSSRELYKRNSGEMADIISNILAIKATAQEKEYIEHVREGALKESIVFNKRFTAQSRFIAMREAITVAVFATLFTFTVQRMSDGAISLTTAVLIVSYATTILTGTYSLSDDLDEHDDIVDRIVPAFDILNRENSVQDPAAPVSLDGAKGTIEFKNVSFSYSEKKDHPILSNFSLTIPHGQKVGIVGVSGAGKSTLTKLLLRFNDVDSGEILLDGVNLRDALQTDIRKRIAYVPQEPLLFHASIRKNILLAQPHASEKDIEAALRAAHAFDFVQELPGGLDSIVGERGVKLSGGQKQRVAIARAVLQHGPVMILDEATSALDSESEQIIKNSFVDILKGKTAIVIAHRLSTLSHMDRIIVISRGKLVEDGTHSELLNKEGIYAGLWARQHRLFGGDETLGEDV